MKLKTFSWVGRQNGITWYCIAIHNEDHSFCKIFEGKSRSNIQAEQRAKDKVKIFLEQNNYMLDLAQ
jgi:hypothetical protein